MAMVASPIWLRLAVWPLRTPISSTSSALKQSSLSSPLGSAHLNQTYLTKLYMHLKVNILTINSIKIFELS